ncbi:outer membrane beta-barrel protein [Plebeiibacterium sediminum]|uniref:PorT family protein n=1 Tax=Plebeiibacterium sediminum TaxID=2992112 RepID=A0AAE3M1V2_9BACT|nr:outer membrane beta-barrel protein [Plebeiobacterium sediminum]MCW3785184.1 PorT family protein [Plebeiobacterium sediminum]
MKIIRFTLLFSLLFIAYNATAQKIGVIGGFNISTISYEPAVNDNKLLVRNHIGIVYEQSISGKEIFVQTGLIFSQKGSAFKDMYVGYGTYVNDNNDIKKMLNYIDIPVLFEYKHSFTNLALI